MHYDGNGSKAVVPDDSAKRLGYDRSGLKGADAALVITGEGSADRQTLMGKLPMGILQHSGRVPVCLIAGQVNDRPELLRGGFSRVECINPPGLTLEEAMKNDVAQQHIRSTLLRLLSTF